jgi:DNA repair protein SbcC/Rad50
VKISEFSIDRYGPLARTGVVRTGAFNLFFGKNENGKTLTIDALIKFLLGKKTKDFRADRVDAFPEGYLKIEINGNSPEGKEKTLPNDGDLPKITKAFSSPLTSSDCRNIFIIRNSDLTLAGETEYFTGITERLVGLRSSDLKKIKKNLLEIGKLTPAMDYSNDEKSLRLKQRLKKAEILIRSIEDAKDELIKEGYKELEVSYYKKTRELAGINETIILYEDARKRSLLEKAVELLNTLEKTISSLNSMELFKDEYLELWQESEREINRSKRELNELYNKAEKIQNSISAAEKQLIELKNNVDLMTNKKKQIDDEKPNLQALKKNFSDVNSDYSLIAILKRLSVFSSIITLAVILSWFYSPSIYLYSAGILSLLVSLILWLYEINLNLKRRKVLREFGRIKYILAEQKINGDTIEEILGTVGKFDEDYSRLIKKNSQYESDLTTLRRHLLETENNNQTNKNIIDEYEKKLLSIKTKTGIKTLQEYSEILKIKLDKGKERDGIANKLEGMLGIHGKSTGEILSQVKVKIDDLGNYKYKGKGIVYNEKVYDDLINRKKAIEDDLRKTRDYISRFENFTARIEPETNDIFPENEEKIYCRTLIDLEEVLTRLKNFIEENNRKRNTIIRTIQIIDEIENDESKRVLELFDDNLSVLFNSITNGNYNEVVYDKEDSIIKVRHSNGGLIDAWKLSGGAYDQLYLTIRLALGDKLLKPEKGFFIMDDPFIKSDMYRIERQMNVLKKICNSGWQVLYFSCKNEIKDILSNDIKNKNINYIDINWINN